MTSAEAARRASRAMQEAGRWLVVQRRLRRVEAVLDGRRRQWGAAFLAYNREADANGWRGGCASRPFVSDAAAGRKDRADRLLLRAQRALSAAGKAARACPACGRVA